MSKKNLHILYEHIFDGRPFGCSYIRIIRPFSHPLNQEVFSVSRAVDYRRADIVVVERTWGPDTTLQDAANLVRRIHRRNAHLIYTLDDNLLDSDSVSANDKTIVRYFAREADGILVSTEPLQKRMSVFNSRVITLPNQLDEQLFEAERQPKESTSSDKLVIGYMGTPTHESDLMMIFEALRTVFRKYDGQLEFQLVGGVADPGVLETLSELPLRVLRVPGSDVAYPNFVRWMLANIHWDLALAPLEDTHFNRNKSDLKFLDYSALGIPGIYSRMPVYMPTIKHLENGYLTANTPQAWTKALEQMIVNHDLRLRLATHAQEYVFANRTLAQHALDWGKGIAQICDESNRFLSGT